MDGWDFVGHPVTDESAKEAIEQLKRQNDILTGIAAGNAGAEFVDAIFDGLLDGQNTSEVFWNWWPLSTGNGATKPALGAFRQDAGQVYKRQNLHRALLRR